ncbi:MAG: hypothetical protein ABSE49_20155, partial [Polyangiaceae bacterium]
MPAPRPLLLCALIVSCSAGASSGHGTAGTADGGADGDNAHDGSAAPSDATTPETGTVDAAAADSAAGDAGVSDGAATYRDPLVQPFASTSIWNTPIGSAAVYVPAKIVPVTGSTLQGDEDVVVLSPSSPSTPVYRNTAGWSTTVSRCPYDAGPLLYDVPLPADFVVGDTPVSDTPNSGLAVLLADGRTIRQTQPFARCTAGAPATSDAVFPDVDLYGPGIPGAHGG